MTQNINYQGGTFECLFRKSGRASRIRLTVHCDGRVIATLPNRFPIKVAEEFVQEKSAWVAKKLNEFKDKNTSILSSRDRKQYLALKEEVRALVKRKLDHYNSYYQHSFKSIRIRDQRTRWGSCSSDGNLNFNYKIIHLPEKYQDYVIVHELCHLKELNHSESFWRLVQKTIPQARQLSKEIRKM